MKFPSTFSRKATPITPLPEAENVEPEKRRGELFRSLTTIVSTFKQEDKERFIEDLLALNEATFEEQYKLSTHDGPANSLLREASVIHSLLGHLVNGNYLGFLTSHALTLITRVRGGWEWVPSTREEMKHVGQTASLLLLHPRYELTPFQLERENVVLQRGTDDGAVLRICIQHQQWDIAKVTMCQALNTLMKNILDGWAGAEAHEQRIYQTMKLCLRIDQTIGALVLHQMAMAHQQRGWDWRPSPDEIDAVAESAARYLVEERYQAAKLVVLDAKQ